jgi:hypothetical protein
MGKMLRNVPQGKRGEAALLQINSNVTTWTNDSMSTNGQQAPPQKLVPLFSIDGMLPVKEVNITCYLLEYVKGIRTPLLLL